MTDMRTRFFESVFLMIGMIVGSGIFAVPYLFVRSGILSGLTMGVIITLIALSVHLMYADIVIVADGKRRLIGNAREKLGPTAGKIAAVIALMGGYGAILSYVLLGGTFLQALLGPYLGGEVIWYQVGILILGMMSLSLGARLIGELNSVLTIGLISLFLTIIAIVGNRVSVSSLTSFSALGMFNPYGILLFSMLGTNAVPEMYELLGRQGEKELRRSVKLGTVGAAVLTLLFGALVAGFTGSQTTPDAIRGLATELGPWMLTIGSVVGLLAVFTSFIVLALNQDETFRSDFKWSLRHSLFATFAPIILMLAIGARDFVKIVSFTGTILTGSACVMIALIYLAMLRSRRDAPLMRYPAIIPYFTIILLVAGVLTEAMK